MSESQYFDSLVTDRDLKFIFVGGKGGVGKTTSSSALAAQLSHERKVLLISTDPAHSLGDAFLMKFSSKPTTIPNLPNLQVMEIDPSATLSTELSEWADLAAKAGFSDDMNAKMRGFQEWLSGVPGIDEATALSSAIDHIESGEYDLIVFDTAPTGHTLKLLGLPEIINAGLEKLESWQSTIWGYWQMIKGGGDSNIVNAKKEISLRLRRYKHSIGKVAKMLQDTQRTRFVLVCIAEFLSISESRRLLDELKQQKVMASHIIVNQLVQIEFTPNEVQAVLKTQTNPSLSEKVKAALFLTSARHGIQSKYLTELKQSREAKGLTICEVPLMSNEVTGADALRKFSNYLVSEKFQQRDMEELKGAATHCKLYDDFIDCDDMDDEQSKTNNVVGVSDNNAMDTFNVNDQVIIQNMVNQVDMNGLQGKITQQTKDGRYGVLLTYKGERKQLVFSPDQLKHAKESAAARAAGEADDTRPQTAPAAGGAMPFAGLGGLGGQGVPLTLGPQPTGAAANPLGGLGGMGGPENMGKMMQLLQDPEIMAEMKKPKISAALQDVMMNPGNFMKYLQDPEVSPVIMKAMGKLK